MTQALLKKGWFTRRRFTPSKYFFCFRRLLAFRKKNHRKKVFFLGSGVLPPKSYSYPYNYLYMNEWIPPPRWRRPRRAWRCWGGQAETWSLNYKSKLILMKQKTLVIIIDVKQIREAAKKLIFLVDVPKNSRRLLSLRRGWDEYFFLAASRRDS